MNIPKECNSVTARLYKGSDTLKSTINGVDNFLRDMQVMAAMKGYSDYLPLEELRILLNQTILELEGLNSLLTQVACYGYLHCEYSSKCKNLKLEGRDNV